MPQLIVIVVLWILALSGASSRTVFDQLFPGVGIGAGGYYYPPAPPAQQPSYSGWYDGGHRQQQQQRPRPQEHQRSYKDICRVVNTNGFTNPGAVPRCPY